MLNRRQLLQQTSALAGVAATGLATGGFPVRAAEPQVSFKNVEAKPFRYCLNTSTIREKKLPLDQLVDLVIDTGYDGIEPWIREIRQYQEAGGSLKDIKKKLSDAGVTVESAIGFASWIVDDEEKRTAALDSARRDMEIVREIGGTRIAAPPVGATNTENFNLFNAAERYGKLLEVGSEVGVTPQLEVWGFSKTLSRMGEAIFVAAESGREDACLLPDVYHIFKGGSDFHSLRMVAGNKMHVFHLNDYPDAPPRKEMNDGHRVYPGDGAAPLSEIYTILYQNGFRGAFSLELFNRDYWKQDPKEVAKTGLEKMKASVQKWQEAVS